jgi:hypothetical protein
MAASYCSCMTWRFVPPHASVERLVPCVWAHALVGAGLVVRGGDLLCEVETCRGGYSIGKLVGAVANWSKTGRLASVGLYQDLLSYLS